MCLIHGLNADSKNVGAHSGDRTQEDVAGLQNNVPPKKVIQLDFNLEQQLLQSALDVSALSCNVPGGPKISVPFLIWQEHDTGASSPSDPLVHAGLSGSTSGSIGIQHSTFKAKPRISWKGADWGRRVELTFRVNTSKQYFLWAEEVSFDSRSLCNLFFCQMFDDFAGTLAE
ncbi:hypothetical protein B0H13DRAFT_1867982 [Mycena leptocephala]|nr:hypothetical protein B0H13DRAFT_1867982 [Mycena leptocephala]